ncbi:D-serine ammonia-lyase [Virgibacillus alimentarius]|nr:MULTISPECIES: D-serine ammonia-lyase [Virgibacillus]HLR69118.1 D-serine ammonia-lyase [Virgibacillus sp.]
MEQYQKKTPLLQKIMELQPVFWLNPRQNEKEHDTTSLNRKDIEEAASLWERFAPFIKKEFPETIETNGIIESPLKLIHSMKSSFSKPVEGDLYLKCDNELPIAGSIKARGGFYEVLHHAEQLAKDAGILSEGANYEIFSTPKFKSFFKQYSIGVGSTGNLGLSIGIMSAKLGFNVFVYMSQDAKQWKKDLLRNKGATVYEFEGDFSKAITEGRRKTHADPNGYFVDDEDSQHLFLGYSTAALRLKKQLEKKNINVDKEHPLFMYLPCGVGGSPGGITFGMKQLFGDHVHCFFVEPVHAPSVLIGLLTGEKEKVCVQDFGIDNKTEADGLAVGRPSKFATTISGQLVSGIYTIEDDELYQLLTLLTDRENIYLEPSATAGLAGPVRILETNYIHQHHINPSNITHIAWATGGGLVPRKDRKDFYNKGKS